MARPWHILPAAPEAVQKLLGTAYGRVFLDLLYHRGISDPAEAERFLRPDYGQLLDPFLFRDMPAATDRLWRAVERGERVCVYGDYDADAVTAVAVLVRTLRYLGLSPVTYVPDRYREGYGLHRDAVSAIASGGATLIVTVDCGTNSAEVAEHCRSLGVDLIVTDHHEQIGAFPEALALLNPKNPAETFPYRELTGVGVAFKLAQALLKDDERVSARRAQLGEGHAVGWEKWLLDLVAIGTVADCHSLLSENRILVSLGLRVMQKTRWVGLRALLNAAANAAGRRFDTYLIGFILAPRLNAAGRLEHADAALELLLTDDREEAARCAARLEDINRRRRELTDRVLGEARERAELLKERAVLVIMAEGWPKGVVGLVAGKLAEEYRKPTVVLEQGAVESTGSARTYGTFDLVRALSVAESALVRYGGHRQAAGLTLKTERFSEFYDLLLRHAASLGEEEQAQQPALVLEAELSANDLTAALAEELLSLEPCGEGNRRPAFMVPKAELLSVRAVGQNQTHAQLSLSVGGKVLPAVYFAAPPYVLQLTPGSRLDVACELMLDGWNGYTQVKLRVIDLRSVAG